MHYYLIFTVVCRVRYCIKGCLLSCLHPEQPPIDCYVNTVNLDMTARTIPIRCNACTQRQYTKTIHHLHLEPESTVSPLKTMRKVSIAPTSHLRISFPPCRLGFRGYWWFKKGYCGHGACGGWQPGRASIREVRVSQLQKVSRQINLPTISHLDISSPPCRRCIRGDSAVGWGGRLAWGLWQSMADEEVRNRIFCEHIKASPQNYWCNQHLTLFFCPSSAVDVHNRPRGSDRVEVGRGSSGRRCHDGGEGQHEVSPCLVYAKSLVSYSKIHECRGYQLNGEISWKGTNGENKNGLSKINSSLNGQWILPLLPPMCDSHPGRGEFTLLIGLSNIKALLVCV
jgi:hypothetical protein